MGDTGRSIHSPRDIVQQSLIFCVHHITATRDWKRTPRRLYSKRAGVSRRDPQRSDRACATNPTSDDLT
jgi:hypothetical protein